MDYLEFLAHSEWPMIAGAALWLLRTPLVRMLDRVSPTKLDAWGFKAEFEKTLSKVELLTGQATISGAIPPPMEAHVRTSERTRTSGTASASATPQPYGTTSIPDPGLPESLGVGASGGEWPGVGTSDSSSPGIASSGSGSSGSGSSISTFTSPDQNSNVSPEVEILEAWRRLEGLMRQMSDAQHPRLAGGLWNSPRRIEEAARDLGLDADEIAALLELRNLRNRVAHSSDVPLTFTEAARFKEASERLLYRMVEGKKIPVPPTPFYGPTSGHER